jgi:broad specificity phosphatase PhoE
MTVLHWARHGENAANLSRRLSYRVYDGDLTERGIAQAEQLAETLRASALQYQLLVSSPLRRARQTADILSARLGLPVAAELDDLREVNVGELDGRNDDAAWLRYDAILAAWRSGQLDQRFPGGESGYELAERIRRAMRAVAMRAVAMRAVAGQVPGTAIVVAHGASIRAAIPLLTGQPDPGADLATGGLARFTVTNTPDGGAEIALAAWPLASSHGST